MQPEKNKIVIVFDNPGSYSGMNNIPFYFNGDNNMQNTFALFLYPNNHVFIDISQDINEYDYTDIRCIYLIETEEGNCFPNNYQILITNLLNKKYELYFLFHEGSVSDLIGRPKIENFINDRLKSPLIFLTQHHVDNSIYGDDLSKIALKIEDNQSFDDEFAELISKFPSMELEAKLEFLHNLLTPEGIGNYLVLSKENKEELQNIENFNVDGTKLLEDLKKLNVAAKNGDCFSKEYVNALREIRDLVLG